jgi:hypothetical protein
MLLKASVLPAAPAISSLALSKVRTFMPIQGQHSDGQFYPKKSPLCFIDSQNFHVSDEMHVCESKKNITSILFIYDEGNPITVMRRMTTFRSTTDRIYEGGPKRLYCNTIVLQLSTVFSTISFCTGLQPRSNRLYID